MPINKALSDKQHECALLRSQLSAEWERAMKMLTLIKHLFLFIYAPRRQQHMWRETNYTKYGLRFGAALIALIETQILISKQFTLMPRHWQGARPWSGGSRAWNGTHE